jgi:protein-S-isoprenylcysteine O-methyltransferase Ste14
MLNIQKLLNRLPRLLLSSIASVLTVAQICLAFLLHGHPAPAWQWFGWILIWSSSIFGILPIITFRRKGGVPKGENYMQTTQLVDTGLYAIVRHPQGGTAWFLINMGLMLIAWHWTSVLLGAISMVLAYLDTFKADQYLIEKFGEAYTSYAAKVPRVNFIVGLIRWARSRHIDIEA